VLVRPAVPADAERVAAVHVASWQGAYRGVFPDEVLDGPDLLARRLRGWQRLLGEPGPREVNLVAEDPGGRPVGLLHGRPSRDHDAGPGTGEVVAIYASPDVWGTGIGRTLMTAGLDRLRSAGFADVTLWVLDSNDRARRFYERAGFGPDGAEKDDVMAGTAIREVRYRRDL
jgi:ribosomal protein S18 acetylase RimI-like enzyme